MGIANNCNFIVVFRVNIRVLQSSNKSLDIT